MDVAVSLPSLQVVVPRTVIGVVALRMSPVTIVLDGAVLRHTAVASDARAMAEFLRDAAVGKTLVTVQMPSWNPSSLETTPDVRSVQLRTETAMRWLTAAELAGYDIERVTFRRWADDLLAMGIGERGEDGRYDATRAAARLAGREIDGRYTHSTLVAFWALKRVMRGGV